MRQRSDIDRVLQVWMADGPTAIPDRVVDVVAARIGVQPQRRAWLFQRRTNVTSPIKLIAGLAAALVVAVVGYTMLPGTSGPGGPPTSAPTPSAQPTVAVSAAPTSGARWPTWYPAEAVRDANGAGILSAGTQATRAFSPAFTYTAVDGWVNAYDEPGYYTLFQDSPANAARFASSGELEHHIVMGLRANPYFTCESAETGSGATAAEVAASVTANDALAVSGVVEVAIGGLTGKQLDIRRSPDWTGTCPSDSELPAGLDPLDERSRGILLDVPDRGLLVIFMGSFSSAEHDAFVAEAMPIIETFEFDTQQ